MEPFRIIWTPPRPSQTLPVDEFCRFVSRSTNRRISGYADLWAWSIDDLESFWRLFCEYFQPKFSVPFHTVYEQNVRMPDVPKFFLGARLNYAENLLDNPAVHAGLDDKCAVVNVRENGSSRAVTFSELRSLVGRFAFALRRHGIKPLDRIAAVTSNSLECLVIYLATASIGAIFSSVAADMGSAGVLSRLVQIRPRLLFHDNAVLYNGKVVHQANKCCEILKGLAEGKPDVVTELVLISNVEEVNQPLNTRHSWMSLDAFLKDAPQNLQPQYAQVDVSHPILICFSSGTTGEPKCIVHGSGILFSQRKEHMLNFNTRPGKDTLLQYTTTSWIMYPALVSALGSGTTIIVYDGSPLVRLEFLPELLEKYRVSIFGTSPRYLIELQRNGFKPKEVFDLKHLRLVTCTGAALTAPTAAAFYSDWPSQVCLLNMSGGTETGACFTIGSVNTPAYAGAVSGRGIAMSVHAYDEDGNECDTSTTGGELICDKPFPSMPVMFWGPNGRKAYMSSYFEKFPNVWTHGDFIRIESETGAVEMLGRSDGTLNPSGVRFGSADIYSVVEKFDEILDALCIGQRRNWDKDERVFLFLKMKNDKPLRKELIQDLNQAIRKAYSPRHVPFKVVEVPDIPYTHNGKKMETLVKKVISSGLVKPTSSMMNPECLQFYQQFYTFDGDEQGRLQISRL